MSADRGMRSAECKIQIAFWLHSVPCALAMALLAVGSVGAAENALPVFVEPTTAWGGQLVQEAVPYQPSMLLAPRSEEHTSELQSH